MITEVNTKKAKKAAPLKVNRLEIGSFMHNAFQIVVQWMVVAPPVAVALNCLKIAHTECENRTGSVFNFPI